MRNLCLSAKICTFIIYSPQPIIEVYKVKSERHPQTPNPQPDTPECFSFCKNSWVYFLDFFFYFEIIIDSHKVAYNEYIGRSYVPFT